MKSPFDACHAAGPKPRRNLAAPWLIALVALAMLAVGLPAHAADWPNHRITLVVPYPPAASSDLIGRLLADHIAMATHATVIVDNRPGAGGTVGTSSVTRAAPDGYTLLLGNNATHVIQPLISRNARYDAVRDFTPIALVADAEEFIGINADLPVHTLAEFIALAKTQPGKLNYGSAGIGSFGQFAGELLKLQAGIDLVHIPYRGSQAAISDLSAGRIQAMLDPAVLTQRADGRVRVLASSGAERFPGSPDVPTMAESGLPDYHLLGWFALFGPAGLPEDVVTKLSGIVADTIADPKVQTILLNSGLTPHAQPAAALAARLAADKVLFADIKARAHIPEVE